MPQNISFDQLPQAVAQLLEEVNLIKQLLETDPAPQGETEEILTVKETAEFLNLSVSTVYGMVQRKEIPVNKKGKRLYFSKLELIDWIKAGKKKTLAEIQAEAEAYLSNKKGGKL